MADNQTELSPMQLAYRAIGLSLWRTRQRALGTNENPPECLFKLMDALAIADEKGSVCIQWEKTEAFLGGEEIQFLTEKRLLAQKPQSDRENIDEEIPFVLDIGERVNRLYMQRHFEQERDVATKILAFTQQDSFSLATAATQTLKHLDTLRYNESSDDDPSRTEQQGAVAEALKKHFFIITGGPGTGKTTVVAKLLECLLAQDASLKVALAAPTGKATSRIMQSLMGSCQRFPSFFSRVLKRIQEKTLAAQTIHKWLLTRNFKGVMPSEKDPLDIDVMIVDEASMIDLRLAQRLLKVVDPKRTRLILLGDKFQLSAVGPGSVLADLTAEDGALANNMAELTISHRFTSDSNVGRLAQAIKSANSSFNGEDFINQFKKAEDGKDKVSIRLYRTGFVDPSLINWIRPHIKSYLQALNDYLKDLENLIVDENLLKKLWDEAERFRILAAQREGANGVNAINRLMESIVREHVGAEEDSLFYPGRLVIIRKNTPVLDVYNGDVGIVIPQADDPTRYDLYIGDRHKRIPVGLLPEHDTAFAMTIHQSQGSQFEHVAVLLPVADDNPLCCRELFYTGVTRAQKEAAVFGTFKSIEASVLHKTERASGLADRLLGQ